MVPRLKWLPLVVLLGLALAISAASCSLGLDDIPDPKKADASTNGPCHPRSCQNNQCGYITDNCGGVKFCGVCNAPEVCGAAGPNQCGFGTCTPVTCGSRCGLVSNNCDSVLDCKGCSFPNTCGGGAKPGECGCTTPSCKDVGAECGYIADPCGGDAIFCGPCSQGKTCGAAGHPNRCGDGACQPRGPCVQNVDCGIFSDGCEGTLDCKTCSKGPCGVVKPNRCNCDPPDCGFRNCGSVTNECGETKNCGDCVSPKVCGGTSTQAVPGVPGICECIPQTCKSLGANCGTALDDGCGGKIDCGEDSCPSPKTCGATDAGVCGCKPPDCAGNCGTMTDECGDPYECQCTPPQSCSGGTCQ